MELKKATRTGRPIARTYLLMNNLNGGKYGTLRIKGINREFCELDFGGDFLRLSPAEIRMVILALGEYLESATGVRTQIAEEVTVERASSVVIDEPTT